MRLLSGRSWVLLAALICACSDGSSKPGTGSGGTSGSGGTGGSAIDAGADRQAPGGSGGGGAGGSGSGGQGGSGSGGSDAAPDMSLPKDAALDATPADAASDGGDASAKNCMERGYDCPGNLVCKPIQTGGWACFPPGVEP